ncbi:tetranectin-like [Physella acuta]|uniref:tetranectin-like n=1 Tax=Physella acuta TaxID=109671 RepID=UPI0027DC59C7|nr:tetranectin-like [Physella acuta]
MPGRNSEQGSSLAPVKVHGLEIQVTPRVLEIGVTRYLTVKCLAPKEIPSTIDSLISLAIFRSDGSQGSAFKELSSINAFHADSQVIQNVKDNETSEGKIDNNGLSYLTLVWEFPDASKAGVYVCQANGVDFSGHPVSKNSPAISVQSTHPGVESLVNQMKNFTTQMEQVLSAVSGLENFREVWINRVQRMKSVMFSSNVSYNGHGYYLSFLHRSMIVHDFSAVCEMFGGYLVEIDSTDEFTFLGNFVNNHSDINWVPTGITDELNENVWINMNAGTVATNYIQFAAREPNGGRGENCLALSRENGWKIVDIACSYAWPSFQMGFVCEIPE